MTAAFVLNFEIPRCRVSAAKYDDARAPPRPESCCQMPPNASTVAAACAAEPRMTSWRSGRCEGTKARTHDANALLVGSSPYKNFVAVPHWHHPTASHNVTTMSLCPTFPSSVCIASENDAAAVSNSGRHRRHTYSCGMCASQKDTTSAASARPHRALSRV